MSPIARAKDHAATSAEADAAAARNSGHGTSSQRGGVGARGGGISQRRQSCPARAPNAGGGGGRAARSRAGAGGGGGVDDVLTEVTVPVSLINLVVHADQRRAPLRMFHFADALPALPPPPPPPPAHNTPSPRLMRPRLKPRVVGSGGIGGGTRGGTGGGGGGRDSGEVGYMLPTTREGVAASAPVDGDGARAPGEQEGGEGRGGIRGSGGAPAVRLCATCETQPVVRIGDGEGAKGAADGGGNSGGGRQGGMEECRGRDGSVLEGDLSTNEQVRRGCFLCVSSAVVVEEVSWYCSEQDTPAQSTSLRFQGRTLYMP